MDVQSETSRKEGRMNHDPIKVSLYQFNGWYYFRYRLPGKKNYTRNSTGTKDRKVAEHRRIELEQRLNSDNPQIYEKIKQIFFKEYVSIFLREYAQEHYSPSTYYATGKRCEILISYLGGKLLGEITSNDIMDLLRNLKGYRDLGNRGINEYRKLLSKMFNYAAEMNYSNYNPVESVRKYKEGNRSKDFGYMTKDEIKRFLAGCNPEFYPIAATLIYTGMRKCELCGLLWENIDLDGDMITISNSYDRPATKDNESRKIGIIPFIREILIKQKSNCNGSIYVFSDTRGKMRKGDFRKVFHSTLKRAGIDKNLTIHDLRHTFATLFLKSSGSIYSLKILMGHSDIKTTERYIHFSDEMGFLKNEINKMPICV